MTRQLCATVFNYSVDGLMADPDTPFWDFCFSLPENSNPNTTGQLEWLRSASAHVFGRVAYDSIAPGMQRNTAHPFSPILNAARKVVFSRTLQTADWPNTTIASGDTTEEVDRLRQGGDGHIVVWGGVRMWRSLMERDLLDEVHVSLFPYVSGRGTRLFEGVPADYALDLVSADPSPSGIVELRYRRRR